MSIALVADAVSHAWHGAPALTGASLSAAAGRVTALVGESGSGKTTLLRCFNRLVDPDHGVVRVGGIDVRGEDPVRLRRRLGYVPQHGGLLPHWSVRRNVALVPTLAGSPDPHAAADDALRLLGLDPGQFGDRLPSELSGGQRQRAALARALAARQEAVLLDEPFGALDAISRGEVHEAFAAARREFAFTALLVTHDLAEAARLADRIVVMRAGRVEQEGDVAELEGVPATEYVRTLFARARAAHAALGPA
jgi:osmoprotectant transport system ATP-binding protein